MREHEHYHYTPVCDVEGCEHPATHKVAAPWTDGTYRELKNFGVYCEMHAEEAWRTPAAVSARSCRPPASRSGRPGSTSSPRAAAMRN